MQTSDPSNGPNRPHIPSFPIMSKNTRRQQPTVRQFTSAQPPSASPEISQARANGPNPRPRQPSPPVKRYLGPHRKTRKREKHPAATIISIHSTCCAPPRWERNILPEYLYEATFPVCADAAARRAPARRCQCRRRPARKSASAR